MANLIARIADPSVCAFFRDMRILAERRLGDIERITRSFLEGWESLEPVDREELVVRVLQKSVTVIDVRPVEEYRFGHIPGAISIPLRDLEARLAELPPDQEVVAYCRGPYCVLAVEAVEMLRGGLPCGAFRRGHPGLASAWLRRRSRGRTVTLKAVT